MKEYLQQLGMTKIILVVITLASVLSISISCFILNEVIERHDEEMIKVIAADVYDDIRNELLKPVMVSRAMAGDIFLHEHLKLENTRTEVEETEFMKNYLTAMQKRFDYDSAFLASENSKNYWRESGLVKKLDLKNDPHDAWYKDAVERTPDYALNIDTDEIKDLTLGIFVNNRIKDSKGNLLGVCGVGLEMARVQKLLQTDEKAYNIKINLVDSTGLVQVDTESDKIEHLYLTRLDYQDNERFVLQKLDNGFVITKYLPNLNWYMVIWRTGANMQSAFANVIFYISVGFAIALAALLLFIQLTLKKGQKRIEESARRHGIASQAGLYVTMNLIDTSTDSIFELSRDPEVKFFSINEGSDANNKLITAAKETTAPDSLQDLLDFLDLKTLSARMKNKNAIHTEFLSELYGWCKAYFMLVDKNDDGSIHQVVFAIEIIEEEKRREKHLLYLSETDSMTGLRNRGSGESNIRDLMAKGTEGMFCLLDADKFKSVNDNYGHDVGDKVIRGIADCLKNTFRPTDITLRLGGDEFAFYVVGVTEEWHGQMIIERLFDAVNKMDIPELGERKISISLGAAIYTVEDDCTFEEIYKRADSATYVSKKTEGNCATFFKEVFE